MVAAMLRTNENDNAPIGLRTTDLRNIAIGLAAAIALIMVAGQISDSGSASASALEDTADKRFTCTFTSNAAQSPNEAQTAVATLTATSDASGTCSFALHGGADQADFSLSGAALTFAATPDHENPADADTNNAYVVIIRATDSADSATTDQTLTATVQDLTLAITAGQSANVAENTNANTEVLDTATTDDAATCQIASGNSDDDGDGNDAFAVDSDCGVKVNDAGDLDREGSGYTTSWTLTLTATTGTGTGHETAVRTVTLTLTDANDNAPVFGDGASATASGAEGGTTVGDYDLTDADSTDPVNTCTDSGTDAGDFTPSKVDGDTCRIAFTSATDFENPADANTDNEYSVNLIATDAGSNSDTIALTITVTNTNDESPVFGAGATASANVNEGTTAVADYDITDADTTDAFNDLSTCTDSGADAGDFTPTKVDADTCRIAFSATPDYESAADANTNNEYIVNLIATDAGGNTDTLALTITVVDLNDNAPEFGDGATASANVAEGVTTVADYDLTDADSSDAVDSCSDSGDDAGDFTPSKVDGDTCRIAFTSAPDYESPADTGTNNVYNVNLIASDGSNTDTIALTITVTDANDNAPVFSDGATDSVSVAEGVTAVGDYDLTDADTTDPLDTNGCTDGGADAGDFTPSRVDGDTCRIAFSATPDYESAADADTNNVYVVNLIGTDAGSNADTITLTVTVTDLNDNAPVFSAGATASANINEGVTTVSDYDLTDADSTDPLASNGCTDGGADAGDFTPTRVDGDTCRIAFSSAPDFENPADADTNNIYVVNLIGTDAGSNSDTITLTLTVVNTNDESPVFSAGATASANVNEGVTTVGDYDVTDADTTDTFNDLNTCTDSGTDAGDFTPTKVDADTCRIALAATPDYESAADADTNNVYLVNLIGTDAGGNSDTLALTVTIVDLNDNAPVFGDGATASANVAEGVTTVADYDLTDPDSSDPVTTNGCTDGGDDAGDFTPSRVDGDTCRIAFTSAPDYESPADTGTNKRTCLRCRRIRICQCQRRNYYYCRL